MNKVLGIAAVLVAAAGAACTPAGASSGTSSSSKPTPTGKPTSQGPTPSVVLVHRAFVDEAGWQGFYQTLRRDGCPVSIVQNTTVSLADDAAAVSRPRSAARSRASAPVG